MNKRDLVKRTNFCTVKETIDEKDYLMDGRKHLQII